MRETKVLKKLRCYAHAGKCPIETCGPACPHYTDGPVFPDASIYETAANALESQMKEQEKLFAGELIPVYLTRSQCNNVAQFLDLNILNDIREDTDMDNPSYVYELLLAKRVLEIAAKGE